MLASYDMSHANLGCNAVIAADRLPGAVIGGARGVMTLGAGLISSGFKDAIAFGAVDRIRRSGRSQTTAPAAGAGTQAWAKDDRTLALASPCNALACWLCAKYDPWLRSPICSAQRFISISPS
jgi:hypothetical protein